MKNSVKVCVPGTTANCGPGFDAVGIGCTVYNTLDLSLLDNKNIVVEIQGEGENIIPCTDQNIVVKAVEKVFRAAGLDMGFKLVMHNNIPISRGLGSSAAAIVAGLFAANEILDDKKFPVEVIFNFATEMEGHPDNVAPAIFGGITLSYVEDHTAGCMRFLPPEELKLVAVVPEFTLPTKLAREALPENVPMSSAVFNVSRTALLIGALCKGEFEHLTYALQDKLHQPYREKLIPGMQDVFNAAKAGGALGAVISGAGSTLMAFTTENAEQIGENMVKAWGIHNIKARYMVLDIDTQGARLL